MYMPKSFVETRSEVLQQLIRAHPFAVVLTHAAAGLTANHLPFELVDATTLHGHVTRGNEPVLMDGAEALRAGAIAGIRARDGDGEAERATFMLAQQESPQ